jgi:hypothetical protein
VLFHVRKGAKIPSLTSFLLLVLLHTDPQPELLFKNTARESPYKNAVMRHHEAIQALQERKFDPIKDKLNLQRAKDLFRVTLEIMDLMHQVH